MAVTDGGGCGCGCGDDGDGGHSGGVSGCD